jgi:hypothetical protein
MERKKCFVGSPDIKTDWASPPNSASGMTRKEFLRLPKAGELCPLTSLTRSKMNELILPCKANNFNPAVRSISLRKRGQARGVRLVVVDSLLAYIYNQEKSAATSKSNRRARRQQPRRPRQNPLDAGDSGPVNPNT